MFAVLRFAFLILLTLSQLNCAFFTQALSSRLNAHPRLFFSADDIPALREKAQTSHRDLWVPISEYVASLVDTSPPLIPPAEGDEDFYRDQGNQLIAMAFACVITGAEEECELTKRYLLIYASWEQWGEKNERGLGHSHMLLGNALAYDWIHSYLAPEERESIRTSIASWTQKMYEAATQPYNESWENWWRRAYLQNHFWIANSALGIAGLALFDTEAMYEQICQVSSGANVNLRTGPGTNYDTSRVLRVGEVVTIHGSGKTDADGMRWWQTADGLWVRADVVREPFNCRTESLHRVAQTWINHAIAQISRGRDILNAISDGSWHEGIPYQNYLLTLTIPFMVNVRELQNVDLLPHEYLKNFTEWRLYNLLPDGGFLLTFGDFDYSWQHAYEPQNILRFVASEYADPYAEWVAQQIIQQRARRANVARAPWYVFEFLYYDAELEPRPPDSRPLAHVFDDAEAIIWRTGWAQDDLVFGMRLGTYAGRYAYETFTSEIYPWDPPCVRSNCTLAIGHDHDDTNTFYLYQDGWLANEVVSTNLFQSSFHNTILIDGESQYRPPFEHYDEIPEDFIGRDPQLLAAVTTEGVSYLASEAAARYTATGLEQVTRHVLFIRPDYLVMLDNMRSTQPHWYEWISHFAADVAVGDRWVRGIGDADRSLHIGIIAPDSVCITTGDDGLPYVRLGVALPIPDVRFITLLYPTNEAEPANVPDAQILEDNGTIAALRVTRNDGALLTEDILIRYADQDSSTRNIDRYIFDGEVAVVTRNAEGDIAKLFMYGGTSLALQNGEEVVLVKHLDKASPFEAIFDGTTVTLSGANLRGAELYAPLAERITVNGEKWSFSIADEYVALNGPIE